MSRFRKTSPQVPSNLNEVFSLTHTGRLGLYRPIELLVTVHNIWLVDCVMHGISVNQIISHYTVRLVTFLPKKHMTGENNVKFIFGSQNSWVKTLDQSSGLLDGLRYYQKISKVSFSILNTWFWGHFGHFFGGFQGLFGEFRRKLYVLLMNFSENFSGFVYVWSRWFWC